MMRISLFQGMILLPFLSRILIIFLKTEFKDSDSGLVLENTQFHIQAFPFAVTDISFYYNDKTASIEPSEFTRRLSVTIPPKGIDVNVKMRLILASATKCGYNSRSRYQLGIAKVTPGSSLTNQRSTCIGRVEYINQDCLPEVVASCFPCHRATRRSYHR